MITLRDYQETCVDEHFNHFRHNHKDNPLFVLPTGAGKSVIQAAFLKETLTAFPSVRILCLTHVKELIEQNHDKLLDVWSMAPAGIYSAGLKRRELGNSITFASIQSVYRRAESLGHVDLVLVDECHLIPWDGAGMYRTLLESLREINPKMKIVGYTATPYRLRGGYLHRGEGAIFGKIAYEVSMETLIEQGHLVPLIARRVENSIDLTGVRKERGEFKQGDVEKAAMRNGATAAAVAEAVNLSLSHGRERWLIFCSGVDHAKEVLGHLQAHGITARGIFSGTPKEDREQWIAQAKNGELDALVNVNVLTTGFDWPECDALWLMRATESPGLYVQIGGRGMRPAEGKENCLVLDYGKNVERHGPVNIVKPKEPGEKTGDAPVKACPECEFYMPTGCLVCPECGYEFPKPEPKVEKTASYEAPYSSAGSWVRVKGAAYFVHHKRDRSGPPTMRVNYETENFFYSEWLCPEHEGYALKKFIQWWVSHGGRSPVPTKVVDAVWRAPREVTPPSEIHVERDGKYFRITARRSA